MVQISYHAVTMSYQARICEWSAIERQQRKIIRALLRLLLQNSANVRSTDTTHIHTNSARRPAKPVNFPLQRNPAPSTVVLLYSRNRSPNGRRSNHQLAATAPLAWS